MVFVHQFNRRVRCTVTVTDEMPAKGKTHIVNFEWTEFPKPLSKHMRECVRWICEANRICADKWNGSIAHAVQVGPRAWELWYFEPGRAPVLVEVIKG